MPDFTANVTACVWALVMLNCSQPAAGCWGPQLAGAFQRRRFCLKHALARAEAREAVTVLGSATHRPDGFRQDLPALAHLTNKGWAKGTRATPVLKVWNNWVLFALQQGKKLQGLVGECLSQANPRMPLNPTL